MLIHAFFCECKRGYDSHGTFQGVLVASQTFGGLAGPGSLEMSKILKH